MFGVWGVKVPLEQPQAPQTARFGVWGLAWDVPPYPGSLQRGS